MTGVEVSFGTLPWAAQLRAALPAVLFGLRMAAAVSIALAIAFELELEQAYWAGATAAIVCQPVLGSALRKAAFRMAGTLVGAVAGVILFACFPQDRVGFTLAFAGWCAMCGFIGSRLTFFAAYGAMLAGYTAAIIVGDAGDTPDRAFDIALSRVTEIEIGIAVATIVLATTQFGSSRKRLTAALQDLTEEVVSGLLDALTPAGRRPKAEDVRGQMVRLAGLAQVVDQVVGEALHWRFPLGPVRAAQDGLFACLAETELLWADRGSGTVAESCVGVVQAALPTRLRFDASSAGRRHSPEEVWNGVRVLGALAGHGPVVEALAARAGRALVAAATSLEASAWLADPARPEPPAGAICAAPPDPLPALANAARVYLAVTAAMVLWIATRWPNGPGAITWTAIPILLLSPQQEKAYDAALGFVIGILLAAGLAAVVDFAVLPQLQTFPEFAVALAVPIVAVSALSTNQRLAWLLGPATINLIPLVSPANQMSYDPDAFYNSALSIVVGCVVAAVFLRAVPPVPMPVRARRILAASRMDGAAIAAGLWRPTTAQWCDRMRTRGAGLPEAANSDIFAELLAVYAAGDGVLRARGRNAPGAVG